MVTMIRQAIVRDQLASAQSELAQAQMLDEHDYIDLARLWSAEARNWFWALQVQAGRLTEETENG